MESSSALDIKGNWNGMSRNKEEEKRSETSLLYSHQLFFPSCSFVSAFIIFHHLSLSTELVVSELNSLRVKYSRFKERARGAKERSEMEKVYIYYLR